jgi:hypothetical protein
MSCEKESKMRVVVPNTFDITATDKSEPTTLSALKRGLAKAKGVVKEAGGALKSRRQRRINTLLAKSTLQDGFARAQLALILGTTSMGLKSIIGTLNVPVSSGDLGKWFESTLEMGQQELFAVVECVAEVEVRPVKSGTVSRIRMEDWDFESVRVDPYSEITRARALVKEDPLMPFGRCIVVDHGSITVIYGNLTQSNISIGSVLTEDTILGEVKTLRLAAFINPIQLNENMWDTGPKKDLGYIPHKEFMLYFEPEQEGIGLGDALVATYATHSKPWGPHWGEVRPPGLPAAARPVSARGEGPRLVTEKALEVSSQNQLFAEVMTKIHIKVTNGGYLAYPSKIFDVRCGVGNLQQDEGGYSYTLDARYASGDDISSSHALSTGNEITTVTVEGSNEVATNAYQHNTTDADRSQAVAEVMVKALQVSAPDSSVGSHANPRANILPPREGGRSEHVRNSAHHDGRAHDFKFYSSSGTYLTRPSKTGSITSGDEFNATVYATQIVMQELGLIPPGGNGWYNSKRGVGEEGSSDVTHYDFRKGWDPRPSAFSAGWYISLGESGGRTIRFTPGSGDKGGTFTFPSVYPDSLIEEVDRVRELAAAGMFDAVPSAFDVYTARVNGETSILWGEGAVNVQTIEGELSLENVECLRDFGPYPRGGGSLPNITGPFRNIDEDSFNSSWGAFGIDFYTWDTLLHSGSVFDNSRSIRILSTLQWPSSTDTDLTAGSKMGMALWASGLESELDFTLNFFNAINTQLQSAANIYSALAISLALADIDAFIYFGEHIYQNKNSLAQTDNQVDSQDSEESQESSEPEVDKKSLSLLCKEAWVSLDSYNMDGVIKGRQTRELVEGFVYSSRNSLVRSCPSLMVGLTSDISPPWINTDDTYGDPTVTVKTFQTTYIEGDVEGRPKSSATISLSSSGGASSTFDSEGGIRTLVRAWGGELTTLGSMKPLTEAPIHRISLAHLGRSFDLSMHCGFITPLNGDQETHNFYLVRPKGDAGFEVWCKVFSHMGVDAAKERARQDNLIRDVTFTDVLIASDMQWPIIGKIEKASWTGEAFNFTALCERNGWYGVSPIAYSSTNYDYTKALWWRFEYRGSIQPGTTKVGRLIREIYTLEDASTNPTTAHPNYDGIKDKVWGEWDQA